MARDEAKWAYWSKQINEWQASGLSRNAVSVLRAHVHLRR
jgi:hypothetical protein